MLKNPEGAFRLHSNQQQHSVCTCNVHEGCPSQQFRIGTSPRNLLCFDCQQNHPSIEVSTKVSVGISSQQGKVPQAESSEVNKGLLQKDFLSAQKANLQTTKQEGKFEVSRHSEKKKSLRKSSEARSSSSNQSSLLDTQVSDNESCKCSHSTQKPQKCSKQSTCLLGEEGCKHCLGHSDSTQKNLESRKVEVNSHKKKETFSTERTHQPTLLSDIQQSELSADEQASLYATQKGGKHIRPKVSFPNVFYFKCGLGHKLELSKEEICEGKWCEKCSQVWKHVHQFAKSNKGKVLDTELSQTVKFRCLRNHTFSVKASE